MTRALDFAALAKSLVNLSEEVLESVFYDGAGVSHIEFNTLPITFKQFKLRFKEVRPAADSSGYLALQFKIGGSWITSGYAWSMLYSSLTTTAGRWGSDGYTYNGMILAPGGLVAGATSTRGEVQISPGKGGAGGFIPTISSWYTNGQTTGLCSAYYNSANRIEAMRIYDTGQNLKTIDVQLIGMRG